MSEHFRRDGGPKHRYETLAEARDAALKQRRVERSARRVVAYRCGFCGGFHIGHGKKLRGPHP